MARSLRDRLNRLAAWIESGIIALVLIHRLKAARRRHEREHRRLMSGKRRPEPTPWPPRLPDGAIDWSAMTYVQVNEVDYEFKPATLEALLGGPMKRMLDLCDEDAAVRASARVMEFARGPVWRFKDRHARSQAEARQVDAAVMTELERRFGDRGSDGRYLIDVFLGSRDHNGCVLTVAAPEGSEARVS